MDKPSNLRRKAAQHFRNAASSTTTAEAERLNEADDLEEMQSQTLRASAPGKSD
jgi:hypothetical protein